MPGGRGGKDIWYTIYDAKKDQYKETREKLREQLREGKLDSRYIDLDVREKVVPFGVISNIGMEELEINLKEMMGSLMPERQKRKKVKRNNKKLA